jgi:hypothetical protein
MDTFVFVVIVLLRFFVPLLIPRFPLPAIIACLVIDAVDQTVFTAFTSYEPPADGATDWYQTYDKALDVYYLAIAYISTMRNWTDPLAFEVARFLYLYRLLGVVLFELVGARWMLLVFANTFEYFFIAYEAVRTKWNPLRLSATAVVAIAGFIWIFIKLPQETWIHVAKLDFTNAMNNHPYMWFVLGGLAIAAVVAGVMNRHRVPEPDWSFTMDVNAHLEVAAPTHAVREKFFDTVLIEKVLLLGMISLIFAQVLQTTSSNTRLFVSVGLLVVLNAAVSQWLRTRGRTWTTAFGEFAAMLGVNVGLVMLDTWVLGVRGDERPNLVTLFFVLLLSLLIALYDRYRAHRDPGVTIEVWKTVKDERRRKLAAAAR